METTPRAPGRRSMDARLLRHHGSVESTSPQVCSRLLLDVHHEVRYIGIAQTSPAFVGSRAERAFSTQIKQRLTNKTSSRAQQQQGKKSTRQKKEAHTNEKTKHNQKQNRTKRNEEKRKQNQQNLSTKSTTNKTARQKQTLTRRSSTGPCPRSW